MPNTQNKMKKKGQAAIEFLVTYGWAILGALIVVGALSYFGIFNTQRYVKDICYFGDQMTCEDSIAYNDGRTSVQLRNNFGTNIDVSVAEVVSDYGRTSCINGTNWISIPSGTLFEVLCDVSGGTISTNNKLKYRMIVTFNRNGPPPINHHNQTGDVTITVQKP